MGQAYRINCIDCKYDEDNQMLVLLVFFEDFGGNRILHMPKSDFHDSRTGKVPSDVEMNRTADLFRDFEFPFTIEINDDPDRTIMDESEQADYVKLFRKEISDEMKQVVEGLQDEDKATIRRLAKVVEKERKKPSVEDVMKEVDFRSKIGDN